MKAVCSRSCPTRTYRVCFLEIEKVTGRTVGGTEMMEVLSLINDFNAAPEVIVYAYSYCLQQE